MASYDNDRRPYRGRDDDDRGWARGSGGSDRGGYGSHDRDDDDDREPIEQGGGRYGMSHHDSRSDRNRQRGGLYGEDDAQGGGSIARDRDFGGGYGNGDRGRSGGMSSSSSQYSGSPYGGGQSGGQHGSGQHGSGLAGGSYRQGSVAMGMGAGLERRAGMAGKGPKGCTRSDDRIKEDVCDCLTNDPHLDASAIEVQVKNGEVTERHRPQPRGQAPRRRSGRRASGVKNVQNTLRVQAGNEAGSKKNERSGTATSIGTSG